jgi:hypothetical protein
MKYFVVTFSILMSIFSGNSPQKDFDFDKAWAEVNKDIDNRLPKSALEKTEKIYIEAEKVNNYPQLTKSLIYIGRLTIETNEDGVEKVMHQYEQKIKTLPEPVKQLVASYLAELYQDYFDSHRWEIADRTTLSDDQDAGFKTWDTQQFLKIIENWYLTSIRDKKAVDFPVDSYKLIMNDYNEAGASFRPTIYEVLVDRALTFFNTYDRYDVTNANSFKVDQAWYFEDAKTFISKKINDKKDASNSYKILSLYQDILKDELSSGKTMVLADYDKRRLEYIYNKSTLDNKDALYVRALEQMAKTYESIDYHTEIVALWAQHIISNNIGKQPKVEALKLCENAIKNYPKSSGAANCKQIIKNIKNPEIQIFSEAVYPADKVLLFAFDHNNIDKVDISVYSLPGEIKNDIINFSQEEILSFVKKQKKIQTFVQKLNVSSEYNIQKTEWSMPGLKYGKYAIVVEGNNTRQFIIFDVSNLAYTTYEKENKRVVVVSDRVSGAPVSNANVEVVQENYNYKSQKFDYKILGTHKTDKSGLVVFDDYFNSNFKIVVKKDKDVLNYENYVYPYTTQEPEPSRFIEFYTDRAIYRPGQTVYFKAILLENDKNEVPSLLKDQKINIELLDANFQVVSKLDKRSNEFGSINGSFVIPEGKLTGMFSIRGGFDSGISGRKTIRVEEYKRPTFEVVINAPKEVTQLNKEVNVKGNAVSLAGVNIDHAQVSYKVTRMTSFPFWRYWWPIPQTGDAFIVKQGDLMTDEAGDFNISFTAIPDETVKKSDNPVFTYKIEVDITDIQGETRSATQFVTAGYTAFQLVADIDQEVDVADLKPLKIIAKGTSGQSLIANGTVEILKLKEPENVKIAKYWDGNTQYPLPLSVYNKSLPYYSPKPVNNYASWEVEKSIMKTNFHTKDSINIASHLKAGVYKIISKAKDQDGKDVEGTDYAVVTDFAKNQLPKTAFLFIKSNQNSYQPGDRFEMNMGTPEAKIQVHVVIEKDNKILATHNLVVDKNAKVSLPIIEAYRGGVNYKWFYIKENRWFSGSGFINVPWTNKELVITYESFRDKTLPGSQEKYNIKISGLNKEKVVAEVLAAMYDASLDQFVRQYWRSSFYPTSYIGRQWQTASFEMKRGLYYFYDNGEIVDHADIEYPELISLMGSSYYYGSGRVKDRSTIMMKSAQFDRYMAHPSPAVLAEASSPNIEEVKNDQQPLGGGSPEFKDEQPLVQPRTNLKETVFFYPDIKTDAEGNLILSYTMNEALTKWKLMLMAHTQDLKIGYDERFVQTQKELMILPNAPRFLRDGDMASINAKVSNLSDKNIKGSAKIQLWDAITMKDITNELVKSDVSAPFDVVKGNSENVNWKIVVPDTKYNAITYRVTAIADGFSDAEENTIPVVTNRTLVTETLPFWVAGNSTRTFTFEAFKNNNSKTKKDFKYTFEYTASPVWYAIQALPYIQESSNASTQTLIDRMYANVLASAIANAHPKIKAVFDQWQVKDKDALVSNLSKNEELKNAILEETPWVRQALSESEQKRNIAILFDLNRLGNEKRATIQKLKERQLPNGGFPWISGGKDNVYITQLILENIGHLIHLGAMSMNDPDWSDIISSGLKYMDESVNERYQKLKIDIKKYGGNLQNDHLDELSIQYLYIRSFFSHVKPLQISDEASKYYYSQGQKYWTNRNLYSQAMIGLILKRNNDKIADSIIKSLRERSFQSEEMGIYWNEGNGFYWYQLPIERHALLIEFFIEASPKKNELDKMKMWLLKNKQTNHWSTSKGTAAAIYALLIQGESNSISSWVTESTQPVIMVGKELLNTSTQASESGTGYIKKSWPAESITNDQATIKVTNNNKSVAWGAAYYQYFETLDNVKTFQDTPLKLNKRMYKVEKTDKGDQLVLITDKTTLKPGDKIQVRIELSVDRDMEYVHMKDMRASGLEPLNVLSSYKYQGGLGYYESTKDLSTQFYFTYLPKGTYVFEYPLRAVHKGDFSAGIATIECMYAPEFASHSDGIRINIK